MSNEHETTPLPAEALWKALVDKIGASRLRAVEDPHPPATVAEEEVVWFEERGAVLVLGNAWGFVVEVRRWGRARPRGEFRFVAAVYVELCIDIDPRLGRMEQPGSAEVDDWSFRPQPHEREAHRRVVEHHAALTRALRSAGFRRSRSDYSPPVVFRCPDEEEPERVRESRVETEASWTFESAAAEEMARVVDRLMGTRLSVSDPLRGESGAGSA